MQFIRPSTDRLNNSHTKLLLRGDAIADASPNARSIENVGGVSVVSKALSFSGSNYIYAAQSTDFDFGARDFTVDGWFNNPTMNATRKSLFSRLNAAGFGLYIRTDAGVAGAISVDISSTGSSWDVATGTSLYGVHTSGWTHVALIRSGNVFSLGINGAIVDSITSSSSIVSVSNPIALATAYYTTTTFYFAGQLANWRVTKGAALWTKNFIPPARLT